MELMRRFYELCQQSHWYEMAESHRTSQKALVMVLPLMALVGIVTCFDIKLTDNKLATFIPHAIAYISVVIAVYGFFECVRGRSYRGLHSLDKYKTFVGDTGSCYKEDGAKAEAHYLKEVIENMCKAQTHNAALNEIRRTHYDKLVWTVIVGYASVIELLITMAVLSN